MLVRRGSRGRLRKPRRALASRIYPFDSISRLQPVPAEALANEQASVPGRDRIPRSARAQFINPISAR